MTQTLAPDTLTDIELPLPGRRVGKVRVAYELSDDRMLFITTDRLSAFDKVVAAVPYKGQVLNQLAAWWFATSGHIVANHAISEPDPNALIAVAAHPLPVEVVVRGHITGVTSTSLWKRYAQGQRVLYGHQLPDGLRKNQELPTPLITPTTKAEAGAHDEALTCAEVTEFGLLDEKLWAHVQEVALALFDHGVVTARRAGLILADTKYEFGLAPDDPSCSSTRCIPPTRRGSGSPTPTTTACGPEKNPKVSTRKSCAGPSPTLDTRATARRLFCPTRSGARPVRATDARSNDSLLRISKQAPHPSPIASRRTWSTCGPRRDRVRFAR